jgi:hypothetical protein
MPDYKSSGSGETGKKEIGASGTFGTTEWNNLVSKTDLEVDSQGRLRLAEDTTIDDFEDSDITSGTPDYGGATSLFSRQASTVYQGEYSLKTENSAKGAISQTDITVSAPITIECRYLHQGQPFGGAYFMTQAEAGEDSGLKGYLLEPNANGDFVMYNYNGSFNQLIKVSSSFPENQWGKIRFEMDGSSPNQITVTAFDSGGNIVNQESTTDDTYTTGGTGFRAHTDGVQYFDNVRFF